MFVKNEMYSRCVGGGDAVVLCCAVHMYVWTGGGDGVGTLLLVLTVRQCLQCYSPSPALLYSSAAYTIDGRERQKSLTGEQRQSHSVAHCARRAHTSNKNKNDPAHDTAMIVIG